MAKVLSWGRKFRFEHRVVRPTERAGLTFETESTTTLAHGLGRSYGDVGLNAGGELVRTDRLRKFIAANWETGIIRAEAGLSIDELLRIAVPKGWFIPVTPGSKFVTLGGAVANDVHGKNHHKVGSFGTIVRALGLRRSDMDGELLTCSRDRNAEIFAQTIGGLGLTGFIEWVEIEMKAIGSSYLNVENIVYSSLEEFFALSEKSQGWDYTVAWVDCFASGKHLGRGIFTRGNFEDEGALIAHPAKSKRSVPVTLPGFTLNRLSITLFNWLYRHRPGARFKGRQHYDPFFYPLDSIANWNRIYGKRGFYQHQSIIPLTQAETTVRNMLQLIRASGQGSFLAVMKMHGLERSPGVLSFCREGVSLALDFPDKGEKTIRVLRALDALVVEAGGALYPAKDGHMSAETFQAIFPQWVEIEAARDPAISSSFWRRVTGCDG